MSRNCDIARRESFEDKILAQIRVEAAYRGFDTWIPISTLGLIPAHATTGVLHRLEAQGKIFLSKKYLNRRSNIPTVQWSVKVNPDGM